MEARLGLHAGYERAHQRAAIVGMDERQQLGAARERRSGPAADEGRADGAEVQRVGGEIVVPLREVAATQGKLEVLLGRGKGPLGAALLGHVAAYAAVAEKAPLAILAALPGDDVHLARAALIVALDLQVEERQALADALEQRFQRARLDLHAGDFPETLAVGRCAAEKRRHRDAAGDPGDAVRGVGLPEPVGGELGQVAEALLARRRLPQHARDPARAPLHHGVNACADEHREKQRFEHAASGSPCRAPAARP